jgi:hypothetical protein
MSQDVGTRTAGGLGGGERPHRSSFADGVGLSRARQQRSYYSQSLVVSLGGGSKVQLRQAFYAVRLSVESKSDASSAKPGQSLTSSTQACLQRGTHGEGMAV